MKEALYGVVRYFCSNDNLVADTNMFMTMSEICLMKSVIPISKQLMCIPMSVRYVKNPLIFTITTMKITGNVIK